MQTYTVQNGDTLYGISKQFGISIEDIKLANNMNSNTITVGTSLIIPSTATTTLYVVKPGDSLYSIAKKYNTTVDDLIRINNLKSNLLHIGQQLKIPINDYNQENGYIVYVIKGGDSLYSIAKKYGLNVEDIKRVNNLMSDTLSIGQHLKLPFSDNNVIKIGSSCYGEGYSEPTYVTYVVKRGDSLYVIAKKFGVSVDSIKKLNNLTSNNLSIGQVLKIKEGS